MKSSLNSVPVLSEEMEALITFCHMFKEKRIFFINSGVLCITIESLSGLFTGHLLTSDFY